MSSWTPSEDLDPACRNLCVALNALPGVESTESCCGHGEEAYRIWFEMDTTAMGAVILSRCLSGRYYCYQKGELRADPIWRAYLGDTEGPPCFVLEGKLMGGTAGKMQRAVLWSYSRFALWDADRRLVPEQHEFKKRLRTFSGDVYEPAELLARNIQEFVENDFATGKELFDYAREEHRP